jgi:hypothetical protein
MGLLFNTADTVKICAKLNRRFSEERLDEIRGDPDRLAKFQNPSANTRTLARIAYKSGLWPTRRPTNNKAKRWFKFLKDIQDNNATVARAIKQALFDGITAQASGVDKYSALTFIAIEGPVLKFTTMDLPIMNGGTQVGLVLLFTLQTPPAATGQHDPSATADSGEDSGQEPNDDDDSGVDPSATVTVISRTRTASKKKASKKKKKKR